MAVADGNELRALSRDFLLAFGEASRLLATEDSAEMAQEGDHRLAAAENGFELDDLVVEGFDRGQLAMPGIGGAGLP